MKTFIYKVIPSSTQRGYNRTVEVFRVKNNVPHYIGYDDKINTASYKGEYSVACHVINRVCGHRLATDGYRMLHEDLFQILEI